MCCDTTVAIVRRLGRAGPLPVCRTGITRPRGCRGPSSLLSSPGRPRCRSGALPPCGAPPDARVQVAGSRLALPLDGAARRAPSAHRDDRLVRGAAPAMRAAARPGGPLGWAADGAPGSQAGGAWTPVLRVQTSVGCLRLPGAFASRARESPRRGSTRRRRWAGCSATDALRGPQGALRGLRRAMAPVEVRAKWKTLAPRDVLGAAVVYGRSACSPRWPSGGRRACCPSARSGRWRWSRGRWVRCGAGLRATGEALHPGAGARVVVAGGRMMSMYQLDDDRWRRWRGIRWWRKDPQRANGGQIRELVMEVKMRRPALSSGGVMTAPVVTDAGKGSPDPITSLRRSTRPRDPPGVQWRNRDPATSGRRASSALPRPPRPSRRTRSPPPRDHALALRRVPSARCVTLRRAQQVLGEWEPLSPRVRRVSVGRGRPSSRCSLPTLPRSTRSTSTTCTSSLRTHHEDQQPHPRQALRISAPLWVACGRRARGGDPARDVPPTGWRITTTDGPDDIRRWTIEQRSQPLTSASDSRGRLRDRGPVKTTRTIVTPALRRHRLRRWAARCSR